MKQTMISRIFPVLVFLPMLLTTACVSAQAVRDDLPIEPLTQFAFSSERTAASDSTPLGYDVWSTRKGEARVPVFESGTTHAEVVAELRRWDLEPFVGAESVVVREGPSRHNFAVDKGEYIVYGFTDGKLGVGPLNSVEMVEVYIHWGLDKEDFYLVNAITAFQQLSSGSLNNLAWALSTHHDRSKRSPALAVRYSLRSNEMTNWEDNADLDTLAAAYAASGDFENAVRFQRQAISLLSEPNRRMQERLVFFENGIPYFEQAPDLHDSGARFPDPALLIRAKRGEADAQYDAAAIFIERGIDDHDGIENPGLHYLRLSAAQNHLEAVEEMGFGYLHGDYGLEADAVAAEQWLQRASNAGSALAAYNLADMYRSATGRERDDVLATQWLMRAADRDLPIAAVEVAYRLLEGVGAERNTELAEKYFALADAADIGPINVIFGGELNDYYYVRSKLESNASAGPSIPVEKFPEHLMQLADDIQAQIGGDRLFVCGDLNGRLTGWMTEDAESVILGLTRSAAALGSRRAQRRLAKIYKKGLGVEPSKENAEYWRQRARHRL